MDTSIVNCGGLAPFHRWLWVLALGLFLSADGSKHAGAAAPAPARTTSAPPAPCPQIGAPAPMSGGTFGMDSSNPIYWVFGSKARMVQVATVGMAIGLFIMMRK
jgi:hypothetical protein